MKSTYLLWLAVSISVVLSIVALVKVRDPKPDLVDIKCRTENVLCFNECKRALDSKMDSIRFDSNQTIIEHNQNIINCYVQNAVDPDGLRQCLDEEEARYNNELATINARREAALNAFESCRDDCDSEERRCREEGFDFHPQEPDIPVIVECNEDGSAIPCRMPVDELCTMVAGACDDCWRTLCPGARWKFSANRPVTVMLIAAADPEKDARTLATSETGTARVALPVPEKIELQNNEKLWLQFDMKEKTGKPVKITVHYEN